MTYQELVLLMAASIYGGLIRDDRVALSDHRAWALKQAKFLIQEGTATLRDKGECNE